jgi:hypothetical protein
MRPDRTRLDAVEPDRRNGPTGGEEIVGDAAAGGEEHHLRLAVLERVDDDEVGAPAGGDEAAIAQAKGRAAEMEAAR